MEMLIAMDYQDNGERVISSIFYYPWTNEQKYSHLNFLTERHDEVYIIKTFDPTSQPFIDEIVTKGCLITKNNY